jgi:hypothetical protein
MPLKLRERNASMTNTLQTFRNNFTESLRATQTLERIAGIALDSVIVCQKLYLAGIPVALIALLFFARTAMRLIVIEQVR